MGQVCPKAVCPCGQLERERCADPCVAGSKQGACVRMRPCDAPSDDISVSPQLSVTPEPECIPSPCRPPRASRCSDQSGAASGCSSLPDPERSMNVHEYLLAAIRAPERARFSMPPPRAGPDSPPRCFAPAPWPTQSVRTPDWRPASVCSNHSISSCSKSTSFSRIQTDVHVPVQMDFVDSCGDSIRVQTAPGALLVTRNGLPVVQAALSVSASAADGTVHFGPSRAVVTLPATARRPHTLGRLRALCELSGVGFTTEAAPAVP
eukprot:TRINITY_DN36424_c0_g1_i1.p1 TRINITY_DN36424_c0_g1~~TRINITY_DN36424_c0_g1_i1.p1  ORF type:complete len:264 (+),score=33.27 TRINITY_DN36424_c0_g1_i1:47-838(+)